MKKSLLIVLIFICISLISCNKIPKNKEKSVESPKIIDQSVLLNVNGQAIYKEELNRIRPSYEEMGLGEREIIEGMILELVTLQEVGKIPLSIGEEEVNKRYEELLSLDKMNFHEKIMKQYGSEEKYKEALKNKMLFDGVVKKVKDYFSTRFSVNKKIIKIRVKDYMSQYESEDFKKNRINEENFSKKVEETYKDSFYTLLGELFFKVQQYKLAQKSDLEFGSYKVCDLFKKEEYGITRDTLKFKGKDYPL